MTVPLSYDSMEQLFLETLPKTVYQSTALRSLPRHKYFVGRQTKFLVWIQIESLNIVHPSIFYRLSLIRIMLSSHADGLKTQQFCTGIAKFRIQMPLMPEISGLPSLLIK